MTVLTFPTNPTLGQLYNAPNQIRYVYDGVKWGVETVASTSLAVTNSVQDRVAPMFVNGPNTGIAFTYNAGTNVMSASITALNGDTLVNGVHELTLESNGNITAPAFTIPNAVGTSGQVLKWPGSGSTLVWAADSNTTTQLVNGDSSFSISSDGTLTLTHPAEPALHPLATVLTVQKAAGNYHTISGAYGLSLQATPVPGGYGLNTNTNFVDIFHDGISVNVNNNTWAFGTDGATTFPTLTVPISDNATPNGTGQTLKFSDSSQQAIIFGPASTSGATSAQRVIIQGAPGYTGTAGEGGDVYLWAGPGGSVNGNGGDIKVRGGYGNGTGSGGYLNLQAGDSATGNGGYINIESGQSSTYGSGGDITVRAQSGGEIYLRTRNSNGANNDWLFGNSGTLTLPAGGIITDSVETVTISGAGTSAVNQTYGKISSGQYIGQTDDAYQIDPPYEPDFNYKLRGALAGGFYESEDLVSWTIVAGAGGGTAPVPTGVILPQRITVTVDSSSWQFGEDGAITLPSGGDIVDSTGASVLGGGTADTGSWTFDTVTATTDGNIIVKAGSGEAAWASLLSNNGANSFWVDDVGAHVTSNFVEGEVTENYWTFGTDGALTLPSGEPILFGNGNSRIQAGMGFHINSEEGISLEAVDATDPLNPITHQWQFGINDTLAYPNSAVQRDTATVTCAGNASTVVYTASSQGKHTIRLLIQVEGNEGAPVGWDTQACEMIIAKSFRANDVAATVYGIVHTSVAPLATFSAEWNALTDRVEVLCATPSANSVYVRTFATEIYTAD